MLSHLSNGARILLGVVVLIVVNFLWVSSSELSRFIYVDSRYNKPFFTTYLKTSLFSLYLLGFVICPSWRLQCKREQHSYSSLRKLSMAALQSFWALYYGLFPGTHLDKIHLCLSSPELLENQKVWRIQNVEEGMVLYEDSDEEEAEDSYPSHPLSDPIFEPIRIQCTPPSSQSCSSCSSGDSTPLQGRVKFSSLVEVRSLSDSEESRIARMSYSQGVMYKRRQKSFAAQFGRSSHGHKLSMFELMRVALTFAVLSFIGGWAYSEALSLAEPSVVNIISSTSGIFVCVLAALFPSNIHDHFTFSKLAAAFLSAVGVVLVTMSTNQTPTTGPFVPNTSPSPLPNYINDSQIIYLPRNDIDVPRSLLPHQSSNEENSANVSPLPDSSRNQLSIVPINNGLNAFLRSSSDKDEPSSQSDTTGKGNSGSSLKDPSNSSGTLSNISSSQLGVLWALMGAFGYAVYLVTLKHQVGDEENIDIPMFIGFVGVFNMVLIGPFIYVFHVLDWEKFEFPDRTTFLYIIVNGLLGTVLSEFLWLWGCFLTSSLAGTLSLSMTSPLSMLADVIFRNDKFSWELYVGSVPVVLSFFLVTLLQHFNNWDPVGDVFRAVPSGSNSRRRPCTSRNHNSESRNDRDRGGTGPSLRFSRGGTGPRYSTGKLKRAAFVLKKPVEATSGLINNVISKKNSQAVKLKVEDDDSEDSSVGGSRNHSMNSSSAQLLLHQTSSSSVSSSSASSS